MVPWLTVISELPKPVTASENVMSALLLLLDVSVGVMTTVGAVVSIVTERALEEAVLPAASRVTAVMLYVPSSRVEVVML